jgi:hypothetical protein
MSCFFYCYADMVVLLSAVMMNVIGLSVAAPPKSIATAAHC